MANAQGAEIGDHKESAACTAPVSAAYTRHAFISRCADLVAFAAAIICVLPLIALAFTQGVDGDEGYYALAGKLVLEGKVPYLDFLYPQTPLFPLLLSYWFKIFGVSWVSGRAFSSAVIILLAFVLYDHVRRQHGRCCGVLATLLLGFNSLASPWFMVVKSYGISAFLLFLGYVAMMRSLRRSSWRLAFSSGVLLLMSAGCRLLCLGAAPAFVWCFWKRGSGKLLKRFVQGCLVGAIPILLVFLRDPRLFLFNNVGYHLLRSNHGFFSGLGRKLEVTAQLFGLSGANRLAGLQVLLVAGMISAAWWWNRRKGRATHPAIMVTGLLLLVNLLPTPNFTQYFCIVVPFAIVGIITFVAELLERAQVTGSWARSGISSLVGAIALGLYFLAPPFSMNQIASLESVSAVTASVNENADSNETVLSFWPGFLLEANAQPQAGFENHFSLRIASRLDEHEEQAYHVGSLVSAWNSIKERQPSVVIIPIVQLSKGMQGTTLGQHLTSARYAAIKSEGDFRIFRREN
ncbi:MAG: glycosyltransferase family 39 protein [Oligoflexia bacterium]|nr:glycosyltransferase family 39 protein [Oligoflexia bacterium]